MGYIIGGRTIRVRLRNTEFDGAECRVEAISVNEYLKIRGAGDEVLIDKFGDYLLDWTLETAVGEPLPCTKESVGEIDSSLALSLAIGWLNGLTKVAKDVPLSSEMLSGLGLTDEPVGNGAVEMEVL